MNQTKLNHVYTTPNFTVVEIDNSFGVISTIETVLVLPFVTDDQGLPLMLGVMKEKNPFREGGFAISPLSGTCESEDADYLATAKRELKEESGFDVSDSEKWYFLGTVTSSKFVDKEYPCFGVDVTGLEKEKASGDGSKNEEESIFIFIPANDVVRSKDVFIPTLFLKLFKFVVGMDLYNREDSVFGKPKGFNVEI